MSLVIVSFWLFWGVFGLVFYACKRENKPEEKQAKLEKDIDKLKIIFMKKEKVAWSAVICLLFVIVLGTVIAESLGYYNAYLLMAGHMPSAIKFIFAACAFATIFSIGKATGSMVAFLKLLKKKDFDGIKEMTQDAKENFTINICRIIVGVITLLTLFT